MDKKGQVTIYVVIGVLILASSVILLSYRSSLFLTAWERERAKSLLVPEKAKEVQDFVLGCVGRTAKEGLDILGSQGGYIQMPEDELPASLANPFSNRLDVLGGLETVYWLYQKPNKVERLQVPTLEEMERSLAGYVEDHLQDCVQDFSAFDYELERSDVIADVDIFDEKVLVTVTYPLTFTQESFSYSLNKFYVELDASLGRLYLLARNILKSAQENHFLEEKTVDLLSLEEGIPFAATEIDCRPKIWREREITEVLKGALAVNVQAVKIAGTKFDTRSEYFVWNVDARDASGLRASLQFIPSWPVTVDATPSEGDLLISKPILPNERKEMAFVSGLFCLQDYKFVYDVSYPVLFVLSDESGYSLQFAYEVVVDNNQPRKNTLALEELPNEDERICGNLGENALVNVLADEDGRLVDAGADLSFRCVATECSVGRGENGRFIGRLPQCVNGQVLARKEGYHEGSAVVDSLEGGTLSVVMSKKYELPVDVQFLDSGFLKEPSADADYYVIFSEQGKGYSAVLTEEDDSVTLIPGSYDVKGYVLLHSDVGFTIEGKTVEQCVNVPRSDVLGVLGVTEEKCTTTVVPDTEITDVVIGGMEVGWNVDSAELSGAEGMSLVIPVYPVPLTMEEMSEVYTDIQSSVNAVAPKLL